MQSDSEKGGKYIAFVSQVKSGSDKANKQVVSDDFSESCTADSDEESDIRAVYQELYEESLKIKKLNHALLKKLDLLE